MPVNHQREQEEDKENRPPNNFSKLAVGNRELSERQLGKVPTFLQSKKGSEHQHRASADNSRFGNNFSHMTASTYLDSSRMEQQKTFKGEKQ